MMKAKNSTKFKHIKYSEYINKESNLKTLFLINLQFFDVLIIILKIIYLNNKTKQTND